MLQEYSCKHIVLVGDLNQHLVARSFEELLTVFGLSNHVDFPTHISGSSLDPVITDFPDNIVKCRALGIVGSSDHEAILSTINIKAERDQPISRTTWLWDKGDWEGFCSDLNAYDWDDVLTGDINDQANAITDILHTLQKKHIPNKSYKAKPQDQAWFGLNCRVAAEEKSKAWTRLKRHRTQQNEALHAAACRNMKYTQRWAIHRWQVDLKTKLTGRSVGSKSWWSSVKQQQGFTPDDCIPPLDKPDGTVATSSKDKAELLASYFSGKMTVPDPDQAPPDLPPRTNSRLRTFTTTTAEVKQHLLLVDVKKALGPDGISPYTLKMCASQLAHPLALLFQNCLHSQTWPTTWKKARVVAVHKKKSRTSPENYRPISLLSTIGKIFEKVLANRITSFLELHHLLSPKQFGFRQNMSAADLLLNMSTTWNSALDSGKDTYVIALDIAGAFDRVWHRGIITKLKSFGLDGNLLMLLQDYLQGRSLRVVINGHTSDEHPVEASVPQGSVLGPLLWNIYLNDILQLIPQAYAYADDCTLTFTCSRDDRPTTISRINQALNLILEWCRRWQVTLAPDKTQVMLISRRQESQNTSQAKIKLEGKTLQQQAAINILGVEFNHDLSFTGHVRNLAKNAARKLACVRRISHLLDSRGCAALYNSQVRSLMEYSPLVWSSCPPSYLNLLDKVQDRARRLVEYKMREHDPPTAFQPLQHRRDVAGLCVVFKVHRLHTPHLATLHLRPAAVPSYTTRTAHRRSEELQVPFARTEHYLRSFLPRYSRLWNRMVRQTELHRTRSMQQFKSNINLWMLLETAGTR